MQSGRTFKRGIAYFQIIQAWALLGQQERRVVNDKLRRCQGQQPPAQTQTPQIRHRRQLDRARVTRWIYRCLKGPDRVRQRPRRNQQQHQLCQQVLAKELGERWISQMEKTWSTSLTRHHQRKRRERSRRREARRRRRSPSPRKSFWVQ